MEHFSPRHTVANKTCRECGAIAKLDYEHTTVPPQGKEDGFVYSRPILKCTDLNCGEEFVAPEADKEFHDAFCMNAGLLLPDEIKKIREEFGKRNERSGKISQRNFALRLGMGSATISRYELRLTIQNRANDLLLRACGELDGFDGLVQNSAQRKTNQAPSNIVPLPIIKSASQRSIDKKADFVLKRRSS